MTRKKSANFDELAKRILTIVDAGKRPQSLKIEPDGTLRAITALITLCFGPDGAEAVARELISEVELYDVGADGFEVDPVTQDRNAFLADLLRKEFTD
jgi:hypothetical protein